MLEQGLIEQAMHRALVLARRGSEHDPNPRVGCVLLAGDGRTVAEGWHRGAGTPHAEIAAIAALPDEWRSRAGELTAVVTLEPCNHTGRTGPCALSLIEFGIGSVVYAVGDPGGVSGGGAETLRAAGIEVRDGVLAEEALDVLRPWLERRDPGARAVSPVPGASSEREGALGDIGIQNADAREDASTRAHGRPRITVKWAQTLDGRIAAADGSSRWITGPEARADVHRRRAGADAILIGTGTLLADDPSLTARSPEGDLLVAADEQPIPVVVGRREIPADARVRRHPALAVRGLREPLRLMGEDLAADLLRLHERGIRSVFVEGGPAIESALIAADLADEALVYIAPALLGGPRLAVGDIGVAGMTGIRRLRVTRTLQLGPDLLVQAMFSPAASTRSGPPPLRGGGGSPTEEGS